MAKTWFITGATRGLGVDIAQAALKAGDRVVATGRKRDQINAAIGPDSDKFLAVAHDVTDAAQAKTAVDAAVQKFGGIDVLVNNAGYGSMGFFEENTMKEVEAQFATNLFGVFHVTWAALPVMRAAKKGHIFNISSVAGVRGVDFGALYSASKFALEGFSESLAKDLAPFNIAITIVEPGPFRTDFLTAESLRFGGRPLADYDERRNKALAGMAERHRKQPGDPVKLAQAMVKLTNEPKPPLRFLAGKFAVETAEAIYKGQLDELAQWRAASIATDY